MKKNTCFIAIFAIILGLALRIYFLGKPGYAFDINCFLTWGLKIKNDGFWSLFSGDYYQSSGMDYPLLVPLISSFWFRLGIANSGVFFKVLPTIFELGLIAINLYFISKSNFKYKNILLFAVIFQPALALVSSAWGQVDSIMSLLILVGFLYWEKNFYISSAFLFLAFLAKPQASIAIFTYFVCLFFRQNKKDFFKQALLWISLFVAFILLFKIFGNSSFFDPYTKSVGRYTNLSLNAFNFWWLSYGQKAWSMHDTAGLYKPIGLVLFIISEIPVVFFAIRKKIDFKMLLLLVSYSYLAFFIFPTEIHERYLFPAVALMAIPAIYGGIPFYIYIVITITFFYNCFAVLESVYPQFPYLSGNLLSGNIPVIVSFVNVLSLIIFAYYLIYEGNKKTKTKTK